MCKKGRYNSERGCDACMDTTTDGVRAGRWKPGWVRAERLSLSTEATRSRRCQPEQHQNSSIAILCSSRHPYWAHHSLASVAASCPAAARFMSSFLSASSSPFARATSIRSDSCKHGRWQRQRHQLRACV